MSDLIANVRTIEKRGNKTIVTVEVVGLKSVPDISKQLRARARALVVTGPVATTTDVIANITAGDIERFTSIQGEPEQIDVDPDLIPFDGLEQVQSLIENRFESLLYTVEVSRHGGRDY